MENRRKFPLSTTHFLVAALIIASFAIGSLWTKVQYLEKGELAVAKTGTATPAPQVQGAADEVKGDVEPLADADHVLGDRKARLLMIEYSDFQCPFCQRFHPTAQQAFDAYKDKLAWVYRHMPLDSIHPLARGAAYASECAYAQGKDEAFWKFADKLFEVTPAIGEDELPKLADSVGLDGNKLKECIAKGDKKDRIDRDITSGSKVGITGTPGTIIYDTKTKKSKLVPGAVPFESLKATIDEMLKG